MPDTILEALIAAAAVIIAAAVGVIFGAPWILRRQNRRLTDAQATLTETQVSHTSVTTTEMTDRIARQWIQELAEEVRELKVELRKEIRARVGAIAYIERLLQWIRDKHPEGAEDLPQIPNQIIDYLLGLDDIDASMTTVDSTKNH